LYRQDLFGALLIKSKRYESYSNLPQVRWPREELPYFPPRLPKGLTKHREVLPTELLNCIEDIMTLQATVSRMRTTALNRLELSNMQASIESRLASGEHACQTLGPVAECCRLAALIVCFMSFTDTWANALVPCRLAAMLQICVDDSLKSSDWSQRRTLQVWILLVGSCVTLVDNSHVDGLTQKWHESLVRFVGYYEELMQDECNLDSADVQSLLEDYVYCDRLVQQRLSIRGWPELETMLKPQKCP
jgi:hypothetical protein